MNSGTPPNEFGESGDFEVAQDDTHYLLAQTFSHRLEALERQFNARIAELEHEVARITTFADAMHGNAYTGGSRSRRPVFRLIRSDDRHPNVIAFDPTAIFERIEQTANSLKHATRLKPVYAVALALAAVGVLLGPRLAVLVEPAGPATGVAVQHAAKRRSQAQQAAKGSQNSQYTRASRFAYHAVPPYLPPKRHAKNSVPIARFVAPPPAPSKPVKMSSPAPSGSTSPSVAPSTPAPSSSTSPTPSPSVSVSGVASNNEAPVPSSS